MSKNGLFVTDQEPNTLSPYLALFSDSFSLVVRELALDLVQLSRSRKNRFFCS